MNYAKTGKYTIAKTVTGKPDEELALTIDNLVTAGYLASKPVPPSGAAKIESSGKTITNPTAYSIDGTTHLVTVNGTNGGTLAAITTK